jgi:processive 1,2-diacylglycerol beta-glucosyltransferase
MKALLLTITAGHGHHATASAVSNALASNGVQCETVDAYEYIAPILKELVARGYLILTERVPKVEGKFYTMAEKRTRSGDRISLTKMANQVLAKPLVSYIRNFDPDVIICTHVFAAGLVNSLKERGHIHTPTIGIITDFTIHPFWEDMQEIEYFVSASEYLTYSAAKRGMDPAKMLPFGIPIDPKFAEKTDSRKVREALGLDPDKTTLLIMSGSMGHGKIDKVIRRLDRLEEDFQAIVVCGNNKAAKEKIEAIDTSHRFLTFGFVNNVEFLMDGSDCIVTKPGGLTTSEAIQKELPMIMVNPIPGQEERNVEFLLNSGMAMYATSTYPVDEAVHYILSCPERIKTMKECIEKVGKKDATQRLCSFIVEKIAKKENQTV